MNGKYGFEGSFSGMGAVALRDPDLEREASEYIADNYDRLVKAAKTMLPGDNEMAIDLLHDVVLSIASAEAAGEGYDAEKGITVEMFVIGRMKGYSKNAKYHKETKNRKLSYHTVERGGKRVHQYEKVGEMIFVDPTIKLDDSYGDASAADMAYHYASYVDDSEGIDALASLRNNIMTCMDFNDAIGFDVLELFRNIDDFGCSFDDGIICKLREAAQYHEDLGDAFRDALLCSQNNREIFDFVVDDLYRQVYAGAV